MIYVSSSCVKADTIQEAVLILIQEGFSNIELSGGTKYYDNFANDLLELKRRYNLNFLVHNYFPPPKQDFVLNLASLDKEIFNQSLKHLENGLEFTRLLGERRFGFHAGFYVDRPICELGKVFSHSSLYDKDKAINKFCHGFDLLKHKFDDIEIYIENNCYSSSNFINYGDDIPFMLLNLDDYEKFKSKINFHLLLDIGHLHVSAKTLGLVFEKELQNLFKESDYIHISGNDALHDQHLGLIKGNGIGKKIKNLNWDNKIITLEVCQGIEALKETYSIISSF
ncbi:MAG: TIM barrel protein [Desulfobacteraceae bacterium]|nr:TIM barrel protein [Desulfobacteraceae bacterium]